jgi:hypothetical protein
MNGKRESAALAASSPRLIAHRGGVVSLDARENSYSALRAATNAGFAGIEIDVRSSRDGVAVLYHEAEARLSDGRTVTVSETSIEVLEKGGLLTLETALSNMPQSLLVMIDCKVRGAAASSFSRTLELILESHQRLEKTLFIGSKENKRYFRGKAWTSIKPRDVSTPAEAANAFRDKQYVFEQGVDLSDADARWCLEHGLLVIPSINRFHYRTRLRSAWRGARRDIKRLWKLGARTFQIDFEYQQYFPPATR